MHRYIVLAVLISLATLTAWAGPFDVAVGQTKVVYRQKGATLRSEPKTLSAATASLAAGRAVRILEVQKSWLRVRADASAGNAQAEGWLRANEVVAPGALRPNPRPSGFSSNVPPGVTQQDISAAGRQFGPDTERGFRASRPQLQQAYTLVDRMEAETTRLVPAESVAFIMDGFLGQGQDYTRPGLVAAGIRHRQGGGGGRGKGQVGRVLRGVGGDLLGRLGGNTAREVAEGVADAAEFAAQLKQNFTPAQEYYLGRAVAAEAIAKYGVDPSPTRRAYVRQIGDAIVRLSRRLPPNYGGYHFEVLDSDEINGVSGPGGFVLITRGAVEAAQSEDQLAAFIAHELAHVSLKHGERVVRQGRNFQGAVQGLARIGARASGLDNDALGAEIVKVFSAAVSDAARTSMEHKYGMGAEFEADLEGTYILVDAVYDHHAVKDVLTIMASNPHAYHGGEAHAPAAQRAQRLQGVISRYGPFPYGSKVLEIRKKRYEERKGS